MCSIAVTLCVLSDYEPTTMLCMPVKVQIGSESRVIAVAVACNKKNEKKLESFPSLPSSSLPSSFCSSITSLPPFSLFSLPPLLPFHSFRLSLISSSFPLPPFLHLVHLHHSAFCTVHQVLHPRRRKHEFCAAVLCVSAR